jgi:hypothetical protein
MDSRYSGGNLARIIVNLFIQKRERRSFAEAGRGLYVRQVPVLNMKTGYRSTIGESARFFRISVLFPLDSR